MPDLDARAVEAALGAFVGVINQVPPMYSAVRRDGRRLYELAREGIEVERAPRAVTVHAITLEGLALPELRLRVRCGKGTYIRALAADLGAALGCGGALASLVRTRVGPYTLEDAVPWIDLREARHADALWQRLRPGDSALASFPGVWLAAAAADRFGHGQAVVVPDIADGQLRVYGPGSAFVGVGLARSGWVKPERLIHADPARPRVLPA